MNKNNQNLKQEPILKLKEKFQEIWELAKPYYEEGRYWDLPQIMWMISVAGPIIEEANLDEDLFIPIIILHDVGYAGISDKTPNPKCKDTKKAHLESGAKIAKEILDRVGYNIEKSKIIVDTILVHDNWVFGDNEPYKKLKELAVFTDLDFMFPAISFDIFKKRAESMKETLEEHFENFINDEKLINRPLACTGTKKLFYDLKDKLKKEINERT